MPEENPTGSMDPIEEFFVNRETDVGKAQQILLQTAWQELKDGIGAGDGYNLDQYTLAEAHLLGLELRDLIIIERGDQTIIYPDELGGPRGLTNFRALAEYIGFREIRNVYEYLALKTPGSPMLKQISLALAGNEPLSWELFSSLQTTLINFGFSDDSDEMQSLAMIYLATLVYVGRETDLQVGSLPSGTHG